MNENELYVVKEYKFDNPLITKIDSIIDGCYRDCQNKYFHTFKYVCIYDITLTNITNNDIINITISDESLGLYELNKKLTIARERGFVFNQINKLTIKIYSNLSSINIHYYLKHQIPMGQRLFLEELLIMVNIFKLIAMIVEILFISHVVDGIHITIQVYLHEYIYIYRYNYSYICINTFFLRIIL